MSVQELSSTAATTAYFEGLAQRLGRRQTLFGLGQGGFVTSTGSVVTRKDDKVLWVDTSGFGGSTAPAGPGPGVSATSSSAALTVASTIMACWSDR